MSLAQRKELKKHLEHPVVSTWDVADGLDTLEGLDGLDSALVDSFALGMRPEMKVWMSEFHGEFHPQMERLEQLKQLEQLEQLEAAHAWLPWTTEFRVVAFHWSQ